MVASDSCLRIGALVIDPMARSVLFRADEVALTRREFDILFALASHPGWAYSSEALAPIEAGVYSSPFSVNVHVSRLRAKLAAAGCSGLIETVRGIGYRVKASSESAPAARPTGEPGSEAGFVGREREMRVLESALSAAMEGDSRFVFVTGEPGFGKTRAAEELARRAPGSVLTAWGHCQPGGSPPYWIWVQLLRGLVDQAVQELASNDALARRLGALSRLLPAVAGAESIGTQQGGLAPEQDVFILFDTVTRFLVELSRQRPLLIVLDDLQWATEPSLLLLEFALRQLVDDRVMIVGLSREGDRSTPALDRVLGESAHRRRSECMELRGFSACEIATFAAAHGLDDLGAEMADAMMIRTGGSPFLLTELVKMIGAEGGETLTPDELSDLVPSPNVRSFVRSRVARLSPECSAVLRAASVFGPTFPLPALEKVAGVSRAELLDLLSEALDARVLKPTRIPELFCFAHALFQQAAYLDVDAARRLQTHARVAEALVETENAANPATAAIAYHYLHAAPAGYGDEAVTYALRAARESMLRYAFADAVIRCEEALAILAAMPETDSRRHLMLETQEAHADALASTGGMERAADAYRRALDAAPPADAADRGRILVKLGGALVETRDWEGALVALDHANEELDSVAESDRDSTWSHSWVRGEIWRMWLYYYQLMGDEMRAHLARTGPLIEKRADAGQLADYLSVVVLWRILADGTWPTDETVEAARNALAAASASGSRTRAVAAQAILGYVLMWNGRLTEAKAHLHDVPPLAKEVGAFLSLMIALAGLSLIGRLEGDTKAVAERAPVSEATAQALGSWYEFGALGTADRAWLAWRAGDLKGARVLAKTARDVWDPVPAFSFYWVAIWPEIAASLELGDADAAIHRARKLVEPGQQLPRGELADLVADALAAADIGDQPQAVRLLRQAVAAGREFGYT
jgi:DNA-binding winged helix-turn-helix (wHTH) protein/tetratricopeptide (TPR) repeat protein